MNAFVLKAAFAVQDILVRPYILLATKSLDATNDTVAQLVAESIRDAFFRRPSEAEWECMSDIESLRNALESSIEPLEIVDYGANALTPEGTIVRRTLGEVTASSSKPKRWASLLFYLVERLVPERCLEFGTCVGISTAYQSAALKLNGNGTIVTMEGSETLAAVAQNNFHELECTNIIPRVGRFDAILEDVLSTYQPFDLVFIDGHHEGAATIRYFEKILPSVSNNAVVVFDDIHWSKSMKDAWRTIVKHRRVKYSADLYQLGMVIVS